MNENIELYKNTAENLFSKKILIVGLGLIGGSYAARLSSFGLIPSAIDIDQESLQYASEKGYIKEDGKTAIEKISNANLIILGLYPSLVVKWIEENQKYFLANTIITDVTGIKKPIVEEVNNILRTDCEFIASHPMAGREVSGVRNAHPDLFLKANFIITPYNNTPKAIELLNQLGNVLGCKHIEILSIDSHDEIIGFLSQLPHAIAIALMNSHEASNYIKYTGDSFRDLTRIAKINESLWSELFLMNKEYLIMEIDNFIKALEVIKQDVSSNDKTHLEMMMIEATSKRKLFDKTN